MKPAKLIDALKDALEDVTAQTNDVTPKWLARRAELLKEDPEWRERLADDREGVTHHFAIATGRPEPDDWLDCYLSVGLYPDGRVGELFVKVGKSGDTLAVLDQWAIAVSVALQYGADARELLAKFAHQRFEPAGATRGCEEIKKCSSVVDYVARWVLLRFYPEAKSVEGTP